jgi:hypothetical protein
MACVEREGSARITPRHAHHQEGAAAVATATAVADTRPKRLADAPAVDRRFITLYRVAGALALLTALLIPLQVIAFIVWPPPQGGAAEWFAVFRDNPIQGLVSYDLVILLEEALLIPIVVALYTLLAGRSPSLMLVATGFWVVSIALFIGANTGFEMLTLANRYAEATDEAARTAYLASGEGMLAAYMGNGTSFVLGYVLASVAGILVGFAMLRTPVFHRAAAYAVIVGNVLGFGLFVPGIGILLSLVSVVILGIWYAAIGWRLLRLEPTDGAA